jgi:hypothetical protein
MNYIVSNNDILHLNNSAIPKYSLRNSLDISLKTYYLGDNYEKKNIYIGKVCNQRYNITELLRNHNCNILTKIDFMSDLKIIIHQPYIITISLVYDDVKLVSISNKSRSIHNLDLMDYFESRFIDINNFANDIYMVIEFASFNKNIKFPTNIGLSCLCYNIGERYKIKKKICETLIVENIKFYNIMSESYKDKVINEDSKKYLYNYINSKNSQFIIKKNNFVCPIIYFSFLFGDLQNDPKSQLYSSCDKYPEINSINVVISINSTINYTIHYNSSRIYSDNINNFHYINFYPDNNNDLIKSNNLLGLNFDELHEIKINFQFNENYAENTKICIGFISFKNLFYN